VGGNIATNAGGVKVIRYGLTRQWVLGLQVVTASGEVLELNGALEKNNTGVDLRQLFIGSEGTLGVITEATLKLTRCPGPRRASSSPCPISPPCSRSSRGATARALRADPRTSSSPTAASPACAPPQGRSRPRRRHPTTCCSRSSARERRRSTGGSPRSSSASSSPTARSRSDSSQAAALWALREGISESLSATGLPHKNDIALPIAALERLLRRARRFFAARYPGWEICLFGHIGDGNLHVNVMKPDAMEKEDFLAKTHEADHAIFELVRTHGGSISAEHGIGLLKKPYLGYTALPEELALCGCPSRGRSSPTRTCAETSPSRSMIEVADVRVGPRYWAWMLAPTSDTMRFTSRSTPGTFRCTFMMRWVPRWARSSTLGKFTRRGGRARGHELDDAGGDLAADGGLGLGRRAADVRREDDVAAGPCSSLTKPSPLASGSSG
jgi:hypothetical protein